MNAYSIYCINHIQFICRRRGDDIYKYISSYYKTNNLQDLYSRSLFPLPHPNKWVVPFDVDDKVKVLPPIVRHQVGRPKTSRFRFGAEASRRMKRGTKKCNICRRVGHTRNSFPERVQE